MSSYTLTTSIENANRIIRALDRKYEREDGETDRELFIRDLKGYYMGLVYRDERRQAVLIAEGTIVPDPNITEVASDG